MLYAISEITLFLLIASFISIFIGWKLHARFNTEWRTAYDSERQVSARLKHELKEFKQLPATISEKNNGLVSKTSSKAARQVKPASAKEEASPVPVVNKPVPEKAKTATAEANDPVDKKTAVKEVSVIAKRTAGNKPVNNDDLKKIKGIGPKLEKMLKKRGITSFRQIANFKKEDIQLVTAAIETFPGRIERDNWMRSAALLHKKTYGDAL